MRSGKTFLHRHATREGLADFLFRIVWHLATLALCFLAHPAQAQGTYQPTWESVNKHIAAPEWFQDAKFGIWWCWGPYSVPAYGSEWYPSYMYYDKAYTNNIVNQRHVATYGDPTVWEYHHFIDGDFDKQGHFVQFAPKLKSAGGNLDPDEWAQLISDAGAKYAGPIAIFSDGFTMAKSVVNPWNAYDKGPHLDLLDLFAKSIRAQNLKLVTTFHTAVNVAAAPGAGKFYTNAPTHTDRSLQKLYGQMSDDDEQNYFYDQVKEIIDNYRPDLIYHDYNLSQIRDSIKLKFLAYYYNQAENWQKEVLVTAKEGVQFNGIVVDYERGGPEDIQHPYWQTDDAISSSSWSYIEGIGYFSAKAEIGALADRVSKGGNLMLCLSPMADGTIPSGQKEVLLSMGTWLKKFGPAIYATRSWTWYGEGPTKMGGGGVHAAPTEGLPQDFRFTRNKTNTTLYAIGLAWPSGNVAVIKSLKSPYFDASQILGISYVGGGSLSWTQDTTGLKIQLPTPGSLDSLAYAVKIDFKGQIPLISKSPITAFQKIEAENVDAKIGTTCILSSAEGGQRLACQTPGDQVLYTSIDFGQGATSFEARVGTQSATPANLVELRLDSPTGKLIGTLNGAGLGGWESYGTISCPVTGATGIHNLFLIFKAPFSFNWFDFKPVTNVAIDTSHPTSIVSATATSQHLGFEASSAIDGDPNTIWHSEWDPLAPLPQSITFDLGTAKGTEALRYTPRQVNPNGRITEYLIETSNDGVVFSPVATGLWSDDATNKLATWPTSMARYLRLVARAGYGGWATAGEVKVFLDSNASTSSHRQLAKPSKLLVTQREHFLTLTGVNGSLANIEIIAIDGRRILSQSILGPETNIPLQGIPQGVYILEIRQPGQATIQWRFVK